MADSRAGPDRTGRDTPLALRAVFWLCAMLFVGDGPLGRGEMAGLAARVAAILAEPSAPLSDDRRDTAALIESRDEGPVQHAVEPTGGDPVVARPVPDRLAHVSRQWTARRASALSDHTYDPPYSPRAPPAAAV